MPYPERLTDHWWWRPGVRPGHPLLVWHILFDDQYEVRDLVARCQGRLNGIPGLDLVPADWLHMTIYIVGEADQIGVADTDAMIRAVAKRLGKLDPIAVNLGKPLFHTEAVALGVEPTDALDPMYQAIVSGVEDAVGPGHVSNELNFVPHVSVAYSNTEAPAEPVIHALSAHPEPCVMTIRDAHLVKQSRVHHLYRWETITSVPLGR